jgi:hypothetical protein
MPPNYNDPRFDGILKDFNSEFDNFVGDFDEKLSATSYIIDEWSSTDERRYKITLSDARSFYESYCNTKRSLEIRHYSQKVASVTFGDNEAPVRTRPDNRSTAWASYLTRLKDANIDSDPIKTSSINILKKFLGQSEPKRGLVIGRVQSGKTANMAGLMALAADNGVNLIIVLGGVLNNLQDQTNKRLAKDLNSINYRPETHDLISWEFLNQDALRGNVGVNDPAHPNQLEFRDSSPKRYVSVVLKNHARLNRLYEWLKKVGKQCGSSVKCLIIDDECDQFGINTDSENRLENASATYKHLQKCLYDVKTFSTIGYVGYTATPYANILNEGPYNQDGSQRENLYPLDVIESIPPASNYFSAKNLFGSSDFPIGLPVLNEIPNNEAEDVKKVMSLQRKEGVQIPDLPNSLKDSICWFLCAVAIRRSRDQRSPTSMLVNNEWGSCYRK